MARRHFPYPLMTLDERAVRAFLNRPLRADDPAVGTWADSIEDLDPGESWTQFIEDLRDLCNALLAQEIGLWFSPHIDTLRHFDLEPFGGAEESPGAYLFAFLGNGLTLLCDPFYPYSLAGGTGADATIDALRNITDSINTAFTQILEMASVVFTDTQLQSRTTTDRMGSSWLITPNGEQEPNHERTHRMGVGNDRQRGLADHSGKRLELSDAGLHRR